MSVRKRVIKILRDICVLQPEFPKVNEICIRIIRRITDEEGIKVKADPLRVKICIVQYINKWQASGPGGNLECIHFVTALT